MDIYKVLQDRFGFDEFRFGQEEIIRDVISQKDVIALLPTGTGKSLCYQLPAYIFDGLTIVISPLLALMEDQVEQLKKMGEKRVVAYNSFLTAKEKKQVLSSLSHYKILYISPESIQAHEVMNALQQIEVSLFVIDEAHCISQWGHEFRTDYMKLATIRMRLGLPPCLALTATATLQVQNDIIHHLKLIDPQVHKYSMDRPNISLGVKQLVTNRDKLNEILSSIQKWSGPGIIYTSSRNAAKEVAEFLRQNGVKKTAYYHGGMEMEERLLIQRQFIQNQLTVICCTSAFGMGVNKSNVRYVIHYHIPSDLGSYLQEIGRAGRDQGASIALLLYAKGDEELQYSLIEQEFPSYEDVEYFIKLVSEQRLTTKREYEAIGVGIGMNENVIRFLIFQLENIKMTDQQAVINEIWDYVEKRKKYKWDRLYRMLQYIKGSDCRRKYLLDEFSEEISSEVRSCCDLCGIEETLYLQNTEDEVTEKDYKWQNELKLIFGMV
jgi:ATP-dependent DNA helicase RecQ